MDIQELGKMLADIRKKEKITQLQLAEKISITNNTISNIEKGNFPCNVDNMLAILNALGYEIELKKKKIVKPNPSEIHLERFSQISKTLARGMSKVGAIYCIGADETYKNDDELHIQSEMICNPEDFDAKIEEIARERNWNRRSIKFFDLKLI